MTAGDRRTEKRSKRAPAVLKTAGALYIIEKTETAGRSISAQIIRSIPVTALD